MDQSKLKEELTAALGWQNAHVNFETATANLDLETLGDQSHGLPYTIWQLAAHIRFAQRDILEFCLGSGYVEAKWPDDYWRAEKAPKSIEEWNKCIEDVKEDRARLASLIKDEERDLFQPFSHGNGQHLFREALLVMDHEAYHTGEIVVARKLLGKWE